MRWQSHHLRSASGVDSHQRLRDGAWPRCRHWQSAVAVCTGGGRVSQWLLPTMAAPTARHIHVSRGRKDAGPGVHFLSPGVLQLTVLRHRRRSHKPAAVCPECGCTFGVGCSTLRPHHATPAYLAASVSWSPTKVVVSCVLPHRGRALWGEPTGTTEPTGDRCFAAAGPKLSNSLPTELRQADISFQRFNRLLKTFLFGCWDYGALWLTVKATTHQFSYLLTYLYVRSINQSIKMSLYLYHLQYMGGSA